MSTNQSESKKVMSAEDIIFIMKDVMNVVQENMMVYSDIKNQPDELEDRNITECEYYMDQIKDTDLTRMAMAKWQEGFGFATKEMIMMATGLEEWNVKFTISHEDNVLIIDYIHTTLFA